MGHTIEGAAVDIFKAVVSNAFLQLENGTEGVTA